MDANNNDNSFVKGFFVNDLFGMYDYEGKLPDLSDERAERLILLHGDNGSGKTTLVKLIYHFLSSLEGVGHRSFVADTRFSSFGLHFSGGLTLVATKIDPSGRGDYDLKLLEQDVLKRSTLLRAELKSDGEYIVPREVVDDEEFLGIMNEVFKNELSCCMLADNRRFMSDSMEDEDIPSSIRTERLLDEVGRISVRHGNISFKEFDETSRQVLQSVERAENWIKIQTLAARSTNDASVSDVYLEIIKRTQKPGISKKINSKDNLIKRLVHLNKELLQLSDMGLTTAIPFAELQESLSSHNEDTIGLVDQLIDPYFESLETRVAGLKVLSSRLRTFLSILNRFYRGKIIKLDAITGFKIENEKGERLNPTSLSSGEKHMLLMLCNILVGTSEQTLFLIDEPELSLNVKWQRELIDALLDLSEGSQVQFIMATHSIELLTYHKNSRLPLRNSNSELQ